MVRDASPFRAGGIGGGAQENRARGGVRARGVHAGAPASARKSERNSGALRGTSVRHATCLHRLALQPRRPMNAISVLARLAMNLRPAVALLFLATGCITR